MTTIIYICAIATITIVHCLARCYFLLRYQWAGSDTYYHLVLGEQIRTTGIANLINERFVIPERVDYPPLLPYLVSITPKSYIRLLQYIAPLADTITLIGVAAAAYAWWSPTAALVTALVYTSTPYTFDMSYSLNPRPIGNMFLSFALIAILNGTLGIFGLIIASALSGAVLLTHRLTTQSLVLCLLIFLAFYPTYTLSLITISLVFAVAASKKFYITSLKGHIEFLQAIGFAKISFSSYCKNMARIAAGNPYILFIASTIVFGGTFGTQKLILLAWIVALFILAQFWPFGEGDRHFANASSSIALLIGSSSTNTAEQLLLAAIIISGFALISAKIYFYPRLAARGAGTISSATLRDGCAAIRIAHQHERTTRPLILVLPQSLSYQVMYFADARVVLASGGTGAGLAYNWRLAKRIHQDGMASLAKYEQPDFVVLLNTAGINIPEADWQPIFKRSGFSIYQRKKGAISPIQFIGNHSVYITST
jgi:hypothetical protein